MKRTFPSLLSAIACGILVSVAQAQAFNIDMATLNSVSPASSFGAAAGQFGNWNHVYQNSNTFLSDISGVSTNVRIQHGFSAMDGSPITGASSDDNLLMKSYWYSGDTTEGMRIFGLAPGDYKFYLYGWGGVWGGSGNTNFLVTPSEKPNYQIFWDPTWTGQDEGHTYAIANVTVKPSTNLVNIRFNLDGGENPPPMLINGLQIVPIPAPASAIGLFAGVLAIGRRQR